MRIKRWLIWMLLIILPKILIAQKVVIGEKLDKTISRAISKNISKYSLFKINPNQLDALLNRAPGTPFKFNLSLPDYGEFPLSLRENDILSDGYTLTVVSQEGKEVISKPGCMTFTGELVNDPNSQVRLTITPQVFFGIIKRGLAEYFIEPLNYVIKNAESNAFIMYERKDVVFDSGFVCGVNETEIARDKMNNSRLASGLSCITAEMAIASDASMFLRYGSAAAVATHNIGVMNNVIWNYSNAQFPTNIEFLIKGQNVSILPTTDQLSPAYTGTKALTVLENFRAWGNSGNFGFTYDLAQFWTTRNLDTDGAGANPGTVGLAYVGAVCGQSKYHILEDFAGSNASGSGFQLEVLTTHEIGHNFNCQHDPTNSPSFMAPGVNNTDTWSDASINAVETFINSTGCMASCETQRTLLTDFIPTPTVICIGNTVQLTDRTQGGPVSWFWSMPGGTPRSSASRNTSVAFASPGLKNIILETNNGLSSDVIGKSVLVSSPPTVGCAPSGSGTSNAGIKSFTLNTINKSSGGAAEDGSTYLDFSCSNNTALQANTTYSATAVVGTSTPSNVFNLVQFFIDYNNDGDFNDLNEFVYSSAQCYIGAHTFTFITPALPPVTDQILRARVIAKECVGGVPNACYTPTNGQVEDYGIIITSNATACTYNYWTGAVNNEWENTGNWSCGSIPTANTHVIIKPGITNFPIISSAAVCKSIYNAAGSTVQVRSGFTLTITGSN